MSASESIVVSKSSVTDQQVVAPEIAQAEGPADVVLNAMKSASLVLTKER